MRRWIVITPGQCFADVRRTAGFLSGCDSCRKIQRKAVPETLLSIGRSGCTIAARNGALRICMVRLEKDEGLSMPEFCRQMGMAMGDRVGDSILQKAAPGGDLLMALVPVFDEIDDRRRSRRVCRRLL